LLFYIGCNDETAKVVSPVIATPNANITTLMKSSNASYQQINDAIEDFAVIIAKSLEDKEFREFLKAEAMNKFDGDFDILYSLVKDKTTKSGKSLSVRVSEIAGEVKKSTGTKFKTEFTNVEELINKIPKLQIAIPINSEKWNTDNFVPPVACLNSELKNKAVTQVKAYDNKGNVIMLDKKNKPDYPVVVISINERLDENGNVREGYIKTKTQNTLYNPKITYKTNSWGTIKRVLVDSGGTGGGGTTHDYLTIKQIMLMNNVCWDEGWWLEGEPEFYVDVWKRVWNLGNNPPYNDSYMGRTYLCVNADAVSNVDRDIVCMTDQKFSNGYNNWTGIHLCEEDGGLLGGDDLCENSWYGAETWQGNPEIGMYQHWLVIDTWHLGSNQNNNIKIQWESR
jgi:hypothetical protein